MLSSFLPCIKSRKLAVHQYEVPPADYVYHDIDKDDDDAGVAVDDDDDDDNAGGCHLFETHGTLPPRPPCLHICKSFQKMVILIRVAIIIIIMS